MTKSASSPEVHPTAPNESFGAVLPWVLFLSFSFVVNYLTRSIFGPLLPGIEEELGVSHAISTRFLFYLAIGYTASLFLSGPACAKIRPRLLVSGSLICSGLLLQLVAATHSRFLLSVLFLVFGFAAGQYFNAGMSVLRSLVRPSQWSRTVSLNEFGPNVAFILGPVLAEFGSAHFGWRGTTSCIGWFSVAAGILFYLFTRGGDEPVGGSVSFKRMAVVLRNKNLWLFAWFIGIAIAGQFAPFSVMILHMTGERALPPDTAAFLLSASRLPMPAGALVGGYLATRIGTRKTLAICGSVYAASLLAMGMPWLAPFVAGLFIQPLFTAMLFPTLFTLLAEIFPVHRQPLLLSIGMPVGSFLGVGIIPGILGIFGDQAGFAAGFLGMGVTVAASLLLLRCLPAPGYGNGGGV